MENFANKYFDKIWCLTSLDKKRIEACNKEFSKYGFDITYYYNPINPIVKACCKLYYETDYYLECANRNGYASVFNAVASCFVGHYNIIKTSYELGFDKILIMEDDIKFIDNIKLDNIFKQIPKKWDVLNFYCPTHRHKETCDMRTYKNLVKDFSGIETDFWEKVNEITDYRGNVMYALSRKAMKTYLDYYDKNNPTLADAHYKFYNPKKILFYIHRYNIIDIKKHTSTITYNEDIN